MTKWQIILEIVIVAMILITVIKNTKNGLLKTLLKSLKGLAVILLALALTPLTVNIVKDNLVTGWFEGTITTPFVETAIEAGENFNYETISASLPDVADGVISLIDKDGSLSSFKGSGVEFAQEFGGRLEALIINIVSNIVTYLALWLILFIVLTVVFKIIEKTVEIPVLKKGDHALGFVWGVISAYIEASFLVAIVPLFAGIEFFDGTFISKFIYEYGLFSSLIEKIL